MLFSARQRAKPQRTPSKIHLALQKLGVFASLREAILRVCPVGFYSQTADYFLSSSSLKTRRKTLPTLETGRLSRNSTCRGRL